MVLRLLNRFVSNYHSLPYRVFRHIRFGDILAFEKSLVKDLSYSTDHNCVANYLYFPITAFASVSKEKMKAIITNALNILHRRRLLSIEVYNSVLVSYIQNDIEFDMKHILQDLSLYGSNRDTLKLLLEIYATKGDLERTENCLSKVVAGEYTNQDVMPCIANYIIARKPDELKCFIDQFAIDTNDQSFLLFKAIGHSVLGEVDEVLNLYESATEDKGQNRNVLIAKFCNLMVKAKAKESDIDKILYTLNEKEPDFMFILYCLNRSGLFETAMNLIDKFSTSLVAEESYMLVNSFNTPRCPLNIYERFIRLMLNKYETFLFTNLFSSYSYDDAFQFFNSDSSIKNTNSLLITLFQKSIIEQSAVHFQNSLEFGLEFPDFRNCFQFKILPVIYGVKYINKNRDFITSLPQYESVVMPHVLLFFAMRKSYFKFNDLISAHIGGDDSLRYQIPVSYSLLGNYLASHLKLSEIDEFIEELLKGFHSYPVCRTSCRLLIQMTLEATSETIDSVLIELVRLTEKYNLEFFENELTLIRSTVSQLKNSEPGPNSMRSSEEKEISSIS